MIVAQNGLHCSIVTDQIDFFSFDMIVNYGQLILMYVSRPIHSIQVLSLLLYIFRRREHLSMKISGRRLRK
jgi:hypothetical protein